MSPRSQPPAPSILFPPGTLGKALAETTARALERGALFAIPTWTALVEQAGVRFLVRVISNLARKEAQRRLRQAASAAREGLDPFMPPEDSLVLTGVSDSHLCLLNKFNVLERHILIVTRAFEPQESPLTAEDFHALWACMAEYHGLGFYNSGEAAGASQPHKHLQMVPLPLGPEGPDVPIAPLLASAEGRADVVTDLPLPFRHAFTWLEDRLWSRPREAATRAVNRYRALLEAAGLAADSPPPYNLLVTRQWMLLVPRSAEKSKGISVNALGFAGALLVRDEAQLARLETMGPMALLQRVAAPV